MIRFFRHIRKMLMEQKKVRSYFLYALGEIALVMIGILLALQVNNWNEDRKTNLQQKELLKGVVESLKTDSLSYEDALITLNDIQQLHEDIYKFTIGEKEAEEIENLQLIRRSSGLTPVTRTNYPDLANQLQDQELKKVVLQYYQTMDLLSFNKDNFNAIVENQVRTFLADKGLLNIAYLFEGQEESWKMLNRDLLFEELKKDGLMQLLFNVHVKVDLFTSQIEWALEQNETLKAKIIQTIGE